MTKKKAGMKNTDGQNQDNEMEETPPAKKDEHAEKDNRIEVKINTNNKKGEKRTDDDIPDNEQDVVSDLREALAAAEKEKTDINERLLRAAADFDNHKKRLDRQWSDFKKYANESMARELLTVVDNLERAIVASQETATVNSSLVDGVKMTLDEILKILERYGVTSITSAGEKFDPNYHQAVSTRPAEDKEGNIVIEEYQKGYMMHDRLLRPAMVVVSSPEQKDQAAE